MDKVYIVWCCPGEGEDYGEIVGIFSIKDVAESWLKKLRLDDHEGRLFNVAIYELDGEEGVRWFLGRAAAEGG